MDDCLEAASEEASDNEEDEEEYETMTMTEAGDVGDNADEQVSVAMLYVAVS